MRILPVIIIVFMILCSCNGQNNSTIDWESYLQPLNDQLTQQTQANDSLYSSLVLVENNPLHDKYLSFRKKRISQHLLIDSLKKLVFKKNSTDYYEVLEKNRKLLLRDGNLEKLQRGENEMVSIV